MRLNPQQWNDSFEAFEPVQRRAYDPVKVHRYYGELLGANAKCPATVRAYEKARRQERLAERARKHRANRGEG